MDSSTRLYDLLSLICMKKHGLVIQSMLPRSPILSDFMTPYGDVWNYENGLACNFSHFHLSPALFTETKNLSAMIIANRFLFHKAELKEQGLCMCITSDPII